MTDIAELTAIAKALNEERHNVLALQRLATLKEDADTAQAQGIIAGRIQKLVDRLKFGPPQLTLQAPPPRKDKKP